MVDRAEICDALHHSCETIGERLSWGIALAASFFPVWHWTMQDVSSYVALATGLGGLCLVLLNIWISVMKIRRLRNHR